MAGMNEPRQPFTIHPAGRASLSCMLLAEFLLLAVSSCVLCQMKLGWFPTEHYVFWKKLHLIAGFAFCTLAVLHILVNFKMLLRHLRGARGLVAISVMVAIVAGTLSAAFFLAQPKEPVTMFPVNDAPATYATPEGE